MDGLWEKLVLTVQAAHRATLDEHGCDERRHHGEPASSLGRARLQSTDEVHQRHPDLGDQLRMNVGLGRDGEGFPEALLRLGELALFAIDVRDLRHRFRDDRSVLGLVGHGESATRGLTRPTE